MDSTRIAAAALMGVALSICSVGCGGESSSTGGGATTVTGTVGGTSVAATSTIATVGPLVETFGPFSSNGVVVLVSNVGSLCSIARRNGDPPNQQQLTIIVASPGMVVPGTYAISTTFSATSDIGYLVYETTDARCMKTSIHAARAGSITLSAITSTTIEGAFDVTTDSGDKLSGTFSTPVCEVSMTNASESGTRATCGG